MLTVVGRTLCANVTGLLCVSDDAAVEGGDLLGLYAGAVRSISRAAGEATVHRSSLLHAVSRVQRGSRYSLIMFFTPDPEGAGTKPDPEGGCRRGVEWS